ncbi:thymidylate synthase [Pseudoalteromonas phage pYD6-A]|uniref:Thymidylate synthase n=1 Tax=Pseudoalteromonas phage pYD6-A TaxID=754052 RepID=M4SMJ5_9CAUD|nr:thymidylate synthase [Pseudoalteromonas phage pYD6-A]AGH57592.1 thymidylate synthase [Pseudoalteromonas phage pYD6-A]
MNAELIDVMGNDLSIVKAARVSFANEDDENRTDMENAKLIRYLAKHNHWTPFAHVQLTLRMRAPVPIRTQCFKHKSGFVENEESRRYIKSTPTFFIPERFRKSCENKKQGSGEDFNDHDNGLMQQIYQNHFDESLKKYEQALRAGVCEEQARFLLPQGAEVNWYWTGSLAAFARFFNQRTDPHAQKEIQDLAHEVGNIIKPLFPIAWRELTHARKEPTNA